MAFVLDLSITDKPKAKAGKARGSNPPGARTRKEPPRVPQDYPYAREEINDNPYTYTKPGVDVPPDSIELRRKVADALLEISLAHEAFHNALKAFHALGNLPPAITEAMTLRQRRYLKVWKK